MSEEILSLEQRLINGLDELNVTYGSEAISKVIDYMNLLHEWNKTHNLTAVDDIDEMLSVHIFDSASIKPYLKGDKLLDVGSGAGLPGMILAILSPALEVTSVESRNKKAQFQMFAANKLKLSNYSVVNSRVEEYQSKELFPMITARAFSSLDNLVELSEHLLAPNGKWLAMKGVVPTDELKAIKARKLKYDTYALTVPELDAQRNLVIIEAKN